MNEDRILDLVEKIYIELQETRSELNETRSDVKETKDEVRQIAIRMDSMDDKLKQLAEIQISHYEENQRNHKEIVEMLSERILGIERVVSNNIKVIK